MSYSLSTNPEDLNRASFWSRRLKSKVGPLKKSLSLSHSEALNMLANCWGITTWNDLLRREKKEEETSYFYHPLTLLDNPDDLEFIKSKFNLPSKALEIFKFDKPNPSNLRTGYIKDYLCSNCRNAIMPVFNDVEVLFRKLLDKEYQLKDRTVKGSFLYIEPKRGAFGVNNTKYLIQILREIWQDFPNLMIYFSYHGIMESRLLGAEIKESLKQFGSQKDLADWTQLPVVKLDQSITFPFENKTTYYYEYLILEPF